MTKNTKPSFPIESLDKALARAGYVCTAEAARMTGRKGGGNTVRMFWRLDVRFLNVSTGKNMTCRQRIFWYIPDLIRRVPEFKRVK